MKLVPTIFRQFLPAGNRSDLFYGDRGREGKVLNKRFFLLAVTLLLAVFLTAGCFPGQSSTSPRKADAPAYLVVQDSTGRTITIPKKPERIVVLSPSFLELLYAVGGNAAGRPSSKTDAIPQAALPVPEVGYVYNINLEKVTALQPDLVIAMQGMHEDLVAPLGNSHIPVITLKYKTIDDTFAAIDLFGKIVGAPDRAEQVAEQVRLQMQAVVEKVPAGPPVKVAILHATAKSVTVEMDSTIAGSIAKALGFTNIAAGSDSLHTGGNMVPYSLETLVAADPDALFVVTMGSQAEIEKRMQADVASNPAWASLRAVQRQKVYFLPADLFLLNPGLQMPAAFQYMAKLIYPEVYGSDR